MAITNGQIITDALRMLGVLGASETASAEQGTNGLRALNQMLETWTESDIELGYYAQDDTTATCPIPAWAEMGVTSKLCQRLMADYPSTMPPAWALNDQENGYSTLARRCFVDKLKGANMNHMPMGSQMRSRILTGG